jgi:hypothetical protein
VSNRIVWTEQAKADIGGIEQPIAIQILKTLGRFVLTGEGATKQLKGVTPPMIRLRAQNHRVFFRDHGTTSRSNAFSTARRPTGNGLKGTLRDQRSAGYAATTNPDGNQMPRTTGFPMLGKT